VFTYTVIQRRQRDSNVNVTVTPDGGGRHQRQRWKTQPARSRQYDFGFTDPPLDADPAGCEDHHTADGELGLVQRHWPLHGRRRVHNSSWPTDVALVANGAAYNALRSRSDNGGTAEPLRPGPGSKHHNTITFNVTAVNDAPDCGRQLARAAINVAVSVAANGTDVENVI
jgi:hypothetical protein